MQLKYRAIQPTKTCTACPRSMLPAAAGGSIALFLVLALVAADRSPPGRRPALLSTEITNSGRALVLAAANYYYSCFKMMSCWPSTTRCAREGEMD